MSTSGEYRALRAAARGDAPPDTQRDFAPPVDCTPEPAHERKTDPQTMPAKRRSSDQWKFNLREAIDDLNATREALAKKPDEPFTEPAPDTEHPCRGNT